jgi:hypothetical protein
MAPHALSGSFTSWARHATEGVVLPEAWRTAWKTGTRRHQIARDVEGLPEHRGKERFRPQRLENVVGKIHPHRR